MINISTVNFNATTSVKNSIHNTIGLCECESGGILGESDGMVSCYFFDRGKIGGEGVYSPNRDRIEEVINVWNLKGVSFWGFIHSHRTSQKLSYADKEFAHMFLRMNDLETVNMCIYLFHLKDFIAYRVRRDYTS